MTSKERKRESEKHLDEGFICGYIYNTLYLIGGIPKKRRAQGKREIIIGIRRKHMYR